MTNVKKIIRTKTRAEGGVTPEEKVALDAHAQKWITNAMRVDRADPTEVGESIRGLYAAADLKAPRVVLVSSPIVMVAAYGAAAAIWHTRKNTPATYDATHAATHAATYDATDAATRDANHAATYDATDAATRAATYAATRAATDAATYAATYAATDAATDAATYAATYAATRDANHAAMRACHDIAGDFGVACAQRWWSAYQGGNMWAAFECYLSGARDVLGLDLPEHKKFATWERAAKCGGFRVMHEEFCIVTDFPEYIKTDENNLPHCENGPSHKWRDGWSLYHWHGVSVPGEWIENPEGFDPSDIIKCENVEQRAAGAAIIGWPRMAERLGRKVIDGDPETDMGALVELTMPGLPEPGRFLMAQCPRNGTICEGVPRVSDIDNLPIETVIAAQAWRDCLSASEYQHPALRT